MEYSAKTTLPLNSIVLVTLCRYSAISPIGIIFHLYSFYKWGRKDKKGSQSLRFWRLMPKGERVLAQSKRTAPPPFKKNSWYISNWYDFNWYIFKNSLSIYFQLISIKTLLKLRGEFHSGGFCFSQRKSIWNRGIKFKILKMLLAILFIYLWLFANNF
jgi:hypothetical protein